MIAHNPHSERPQELVDEFKQQAGEAYYEYVEPDRVAISELQGIISPHMKR